MNSARRPALHRFGDALNFLLTNRVPRQRLTVLMGRLSAIRSPVLAALAIAVWRRFSDLDLSDARKRSFDSLQDCFTRELVDGARPFDAAPDVLASPCDAIVGACGAIEDGTLLQAKGSSYALADLLGDVRRAAGYSGGSYATLRLKADMYHRFHAPCDARVEDITYFAGDAWNVNPPALARVPRLFCRNERALVPLRLGDAGPVVTLVPVAAILVASIRFTFLDVRLHLRYRGPNLIRCETPVRKGDTLGWFEHGSTIIVLAPRGFRLAAGVAQGTRLRAGQALMNLPPGR